MKKQLTKTLLTALLVAVLMTVFAVSASAAETTVTTEDALRTAVTGAADGDVIIVKGTIELSSNITLPKGTNEDTRVTITIKGDPADGADEIVAKSTFVNGGVSGETVSTGSMFTANSWSTLVLRDIKINANLYVKGDNDAYALRTGVENPKLRCVLLGGYKGYCELRGDTVITGGYAPNGAGVYSNGRLYMYDNSKVSGNYGTGSGGGVYMHNSDGTYHYLELHNNAKVEYNTTAAEATGGAGVYCTGSQGRIYLYNNGSISNNTSNSAGGGVYLNNGYLTINGDGATISNNTAAKHGGGVYNKGEMTLTNGNISGNTAGATAAGDGGGVYNAKTFKINGGYLSGNTVKTLNYGGSAVFSSSDGTLTINGGLIGKHSSYPNSAANTGNCAAIITRGTAVMNGGYISGNVNAASSGYGGGIRVGAGTFELNGGEISGNKSGKGGAIFNQGTTTLNDATISGNQARDGGAIYNAGTFNIVGGVIGGNSIYSTNYGGSAIFNGAIDTKISSAAVINMSGGLIGTDGTKGAANTGFAIIRNRGVFNMTGGKIAGNSNAANGGGTVQNQYEFNLDGATAEICNNKSQSGGAIYNRGYSSTDAAVLNIKNGKIYGNTATQYGGGIYAGEYKGEINISGGEIYDNMSLRTGSLGMGYSGGGGLCAYGNVVVNISGNAQIYNNHAFAGAGIQVLDNGDSIPKLTMTGGYIYGNEAMLNGGAGIVYVAAGTENTIDGAKIGVKPDGTAAPNISRVYKYDENGYVEVDGEYVLNTDKDNGYSTGGGLCIVNGSVTVTNTVISNNVARSGAGVYAQNATVVLGDGVVVENNTTSKYGAGVCVYGSTLTAQGTAQIINNTATGSGGGIWLENTSANKAIINLKDSVKVAGNKAVTGAGIYFYTADAETGSTIGGNVVISGNTSSSTGGGIYLSKGKLSMTGGTVTGNRGSAAGGVYVADYAETVFNVSGSTTITDNYRGAEGTLECNVELDDYLDYPARINVTANHTGEIGVYFNALTVNTGAYAVVGAAGEGITCNITNDNGDFAAITAPVEGKLQFGSGETVTVTVKNLAGDTKVYTIAKADTIKYRMPTTDKLTGITYTGEFIGYKLGETLYKADDISKTYLTKAQIDGGVINIIALEVATKQGASVNLSERSGMRFVTKVDADVLEALTELGFSYQRGLMVSNESLTGVEIDTDKANVKTGTADGSFVDAANHANATWKGNYYLGADETEAGYEAFSIALQLDDTNYETVFYFRGYVTLKLGEEEITVYSDYTDEYCRSARGVAQSYCGVINESETPVTLTDAQSSALEALSGWTCDPETGKWAAAE